MPTSPVITLANEYRAALLTKDAQAVNRLVDAYRRAYSRLAAEFEALLSVIGDEAPTKAQLLKMARYRELMERVADELRDFQGLTAREIDAAVRLGIDLGGKHGRGLLSTAVVGTPEVSAAFNALPTGAIETLLGYLTPEGALYQRLKLLAPHTASLVSDAFVSGVAMGYNPRKIAAMVRGAFGNGLTDALRFTRTAQLWAYRESSRATYIANADVLDGWVWFANLGDTRTCLSCINMHGTIHKLSETLNDHFLGRCVALPIVNGMSPLANPGDGEKWFSDQPEVSQKKMMGLSKWNAWRDGKFDFGMLTATSNDPVYGDMRVERSLKAILEMVGDGK